MSERMSKDMSERMSERMSKDMSENVRKNIGRYVKRYVRKNVRRYIRRYVRKNVNQKICQKERQKIASSQSAKLRVTERISGDELYVYPHLTRSGWHKWMWRENFVIDKMETGWAQSMTFGFGFGVFKRKMLNRGRCITGVMWKWNFVRSCWCCCLRRGGGLDAETKRSSSTNWHHILSWIHSQTASLLELDDNPHLTTSTQHVMVGITRSKVICFFWLCFDRKRKKKAKAASSQQPVSQQYIYQYKIQYIIPNTVSNKEAIAREDSFHNQLKNLFSYPLIVFFFWGGVINHFQTLYM